MTDLPQRADEAPAIAFVPYGTKITPGLARMSLDDLSWPLGKPLRLEGGAVADMGPEDHLIAFVSSRLLYMPRQGVRARMSVMVVEPEAVHRRNMIWLRLLWWRFFAVLTCNPALLAAIPNGHRFVFGSTWIPDWRAVDTTKSRMLSLIASQKRTYEGHKLRHRTAASLREEPEEAREPGTWAKACAADSLTVHLTGPEADAVVLYEQIFSRLTGVWLRFQDRHGDPMAIALPPDAIRPVGFDPADFLIPEDPRVFRGFHFLREYFWYPRKFLAFEITGLARALSFVETNRFDIVLGFSDAHVRLPQAVSRRAFSLYTAPAVNLFMKSMDRIAVEGSRHEYHVVPDRTHPIDYEPYRITEVYAHFAGGQAKAPVRPLYSGTGRKEDTGEGLYYTLRRLPRKRSSQEERYGRASSYAGTELFLSVTEPPGGGYGSKISQISLRGLCSNRHLTEQLPVGDGGVDFTLIENTELAGRIYGYVGGFDTAVYVYRGFWHSPPGFQVGEESAVQFYPALSVYGASAQGGFATGVLSAETGSPQLSN